MVRQTGVNTGRCNKVENPPSEHEDGTLSIGYMVPTQECR